MRGFIEPGRPDVNTEQRVKHAVNETSCTELVCSVSCRRMDNNFVVIALGHRSCLSINGIVEGTNLGFPSILCYVTGVIEG